MPGRPGGRKYAHPRGMIRVCVLLVFLAVLTSACSTPRGAHTTRFKDQEHANLIVRYYTDDTNYVLKPEAKEGPFLSILDQNGVLAVARRQTGRDLAVVVLIHYAGENQANFVKNKWRNLLTEAGYRRVVFLRGRTGMRVNGLPVLSSPS